MANQYRDRIISSLSEKDVGQELRVCGWIENIRDHGGVSFIDLRDMYGTLQVVMRDTSLLVTHHFLTDSLRKNASPFRARSSTGTKRLITPRSLQVRSSLKLTRLTFSVRSTASFLSRS